MRDSEINYKEEDDDQSSSSFSNVKGLLATGLLEGVSVTYIFKKHKAELHGFIKDDGYQCGCSSCNYTQVLGANEFERHAGATSSHPNNHIILENGKTLHEVVKCLADVPSVSLHKEIEVVTGCRINSNSNDARRNGSSQTANHEAKQTASHEVKQTRVDGKTSQDAPYIFFSRLPSNLSFFHKTTNGDPGFSPNPRTGLKRAHQDPEEPSPEKKRGVDSSNFSQIKVTESEDFSPRTPPNRQKKEAEIFKKGRLDVRSLLATGVLEGFPVKYKKDKVELHGFIKDQGYQCGCSSCNYKEVISALKFETHAGVTSHNQNNHIFLESGISLYALVKELGNVPLDSLGEVIVEKIGCPVNMERFEIWKGSFRTASLDLLKTSENGAKNQQTQGAELHNNPHSVKSFPGPATEGSFDPGSCINLKLISPGSATKGSVNPTPSMNNNVTFSGSATEGSVHPGSNISAPSSSIDQKSSITETKSEMKKSSPGLHTEGSFATPSSINFMFSSPRPATVGNIIPSLNIDANVSFLGSAKEGSMYPGSSKPLHGSSITQKSSMLKTRLERRKRSPASPDLLESAVHLVQQKGGAQGGPRKRSGDLHRIIFKENGLPDGAELSYHSNGQKVLTGYKNENGILCGCCNKVVSPSKFETHAGFPSKRQPYRNIYTSNGISLRELTISLSNCQKLTSVCTICGGGGEMVSCNGCPKAFHTDCLGLPCIPDADGEWYCLSCKDKFGSGTASKVMSQSAAKLINLRLRRVIKHPTEDCCALCEDTAAIMGKELVPKTIIFCGQCEKEYHIGCLKDHGICDLQEMPRPWFSWVCSADCTTIRENLQTLVHSAPCSIPESPLSILKRKIEDVGLTNEIGSDVQWQLLSGTYKTSENRLLFSKATAIFQDAFDPIVERGCDLIPAMVEGQELAGQYFGGMYCAVITVQSVIVSAGLLRVFGRDVAELPLVATTKQNQGKGYFQTLLSIIEWLLIRLKVKFLIVPVDEDAQSMWIDKFGFVKMREERVKKYAKDHWILMFHKTTILEKALPQFQG